MNFMSLISFFLAAAVLGFGIQASGDYHTFLNEHAILIVVGGTVAAGSISFQINRIALMFKIFFRRVLQGRKEDFAKNIAELMALAEAYRTNSPNLEKMVSGSKDYFLKEAMTALMEGVLDEPTLIRVLRARANTMYHRQNEEVMKFKIVGRYPPAFGLMGTTLSMIDLLKKLGEPGAQNLLGPAMALGLVATFYGLVLSNMIFNPIADNLGDSAKETKLKNTIIVEGVRLILARTNPVVLAEELNSYLLPSERIDWKQASKGNAAAAPGKAA